MGSNAIALNLSKESGSIDKKLLSRLADFRRQVGRGEGFEWTVKNSWRKSFFQIVLNEVLKNFWKKIFADVKANIKQQEIKDLVPYRFL